MAFLLDTHAFLWFVSGDSKLPSSIRDKIMDMNQPCFLSVASLWEITIKNQLGKLQLNISLNDLFDYADRNQIEIVQINYDHLRTLSTLPNHHGDPFDRLIISQAISEKLVLITRDKGLKNIRQNSNGHKRQRLTANLAAIGRTRSSFGQAKVRYRACFSFALTKKHLYI